MNNNRIREIIPENNQDEKEEAVWDEIKEQPLNDRLSRGFLEDVETQKKENPEIWEKMKTVANNMVSSLGFKPEQESFLVITDDNVIKENPMLVLALKEILSEATEKSQRTKGNYKIMVAPASFKSATPFGDAIGDKMINAPVIILTSMSRSHSPETGTAIRGDISPKNKFEDIFEDMVIKEYQDTDGEINVAGPLFDEDRYYEALQKLAKDKRARVISCTKGTNPFEILTKGAVEESPAVLKEKAGKLIEMMKDVEQVHITTKDGTDLVMNIRPDKDEYEDGDMCKPGAFSNYPIGEWACSPFWKGANGTLVVDGPFGGMNEEGRNHNLDWVKEAGLFKLTIKEGEIIEINGKSIETQRNNPENPLIASFIAYLDSGNNDQSHGYKLAEFAVGTNTKACQGKPDEHWGSTETEKKYGTCHIAVGSNGTFGVDRKDPNYNAAKIHCDMIILGEGLEIKCTKKDKDEFYLIKNGEPQGY